MPLGGEKWVKVPRSGEEGVENPRKHIF